MHGLACMLVQHCRELIYESTWSFRVCRCMRGPYILTHAVQWNYFYGKTHVLMGVLRDNLEARSSARTGSFVLLKGITCSSMPGSDQDRTSFTDPPWFLGMFTILLFFFFIKLYLQGFTVIGQSWTSGYLDLHCNYFDHFLICLSQVDKLYGSALVNRWSTTSNIWLKSH